MVTVVSLDPGAATRRRNIRAGRRERRLRRRPAPVRQRHRHVPDEQRHDSAAAREPDDSPAGVRHLRPRAGSLPRLGKRARAAARLLRAVGVPGPSARHDDHVHPARQHRRRRARPPGRSAGAGRLGRRPRRRRAGLRGALCRRPRLRRHVPADRSAARHRPVRPDQAGAARHPVHDRLLQPAAAAVRRPAAGHRPQRGPGPALFPVRTRLAPASSSPAACSCRCST